MNTTSTGSWSRTAKLAVAVACACAATAAQAAWVTEFSGGVESRYDDNVRLSVEGDEEESAVTTTVGGEMRIRNVTQTSEVAMVLGASYLNYAAYDGEDELDDEDIEYLDLRARNRGEVWEVGVNGSVRRDLMLRTIGFIVDPLDEPTTQTGDTGGGAPDRGPGTELGEVAADVDAGAVEEQVRRTRSQVNPYVRYQLSQRTALQADYNFLDQTYDDDSPQGLEDSQSQSVGLELSNQLGQLDWLRIGVRAARFEPEDDPEETDAYELSLGWDRQFSERIYAGVDVGAQQTQRDDDDETGYLVRLRATRSTDNGALRAYYEHSFQPSGYGALVESDSLDIGYRHQMTERMTWAFGARGYRTRESSNAPENENNDRDFVDVGPDFSYSLTELLSIGVFYRYRWVDRQAVGDGSSNTFGIQLRLDPRRRL